MAVTLSPSRLGLFAECARCFWLAEREGLRRPRRPFPSLPSGMDREIRAHFDRQRARGELPPALDGRVDERLYPGQAFLDGARDWRAAPRLVDEALGAVLRGGVDDLLETDDGQLVVLDYKTRGTPPPGDGAPRYYRRQLSLYHLLLEAAGHPTADHAYLLYYHPEGVTGGGTVTFGTDLVRVEVDVAAARRLLEEAVAALDGTLPRPGSDCEFCEWAEARASS